MRLLADSSILHAGCSQDSKPLIPSFSVAWRFEGTHISEPGKDGQSLDPTQGWPFYCQDQYQVLTLLRPLITTINSPFFTSVARSYT